MSDWYVYVVYESPIVPPYYCKVGYTNNPQRRLLELQQGNPRVLRTPDYSRQPVGEFGLRLETERAAKELEARVHSCLASMASRLIGDVDYAKGNAPNREWFADVHPEKVWLLVVQEYDKMSRP